MIGWIIFALVYVVGIFVSHKYVFGPWVDEADSTTTKFDAAWYSTFWLPIVPLFGIYVIYRKMNGLD